MQIFISHPSSFLTNHQPHGDGLLAYEFINRLAERGHKVYVALAHKDLKGELHPNIQLRQATPKINIAALRPFEYMLRVRRAFDEVNKENPIDVIHQLNPVEDGLSWLLARTGVPLVLGLFVPAWSYESEPQRSAMPLKSRLLRQFTMPLLQLLDAQQERAAAALILSTCAAASSLHNAEMHQLKIHILPFGVDTQQFSPSVDSRVERKEELSILYLANIYERKGIFTLLEAFEQVSRELPKCRLSIAGAGAQLHEARQRVAAMQCNANIDFLGNIERAYIPEVMRQCSVYCLPSYGEPFGMTALEAMSCGKPVVATKAGGLEFIVSEQGGRKVPVKDSNALANALIEVLSSSVLRHSMGVYNRKIVLDKYAWDLVINNLEDVYSSMILKAQD